MARPAGQPTLTARGEVEGMAASRWRTEEAPRGMAAAHRGSASRVHRGSRIGQGEAAESAGRQRRGGAPKKRAARGRRGGASVEDWRRRRVGMPRADRARRGGGGGRRSASEEVAEDDRRGAWKEEVRKKRRIQGTKLYTPKALGTG